MLIKTFSTDKKGLRKSKSIGFPKVVADKKEYDSFPKLAK
jgi:hypothetical protein